MTWEIEPSKPFEKYVRTDGTMKLAEPARLKRTSKRTKTASKNKYGLTRAGLRAARKQLMNFRSKCSSCNQPAILGLTGQCGSCMAESVGG